MAQERQELSPGAIIRAIPKWLLGVSFALFVALLINSIFIMRTPFVIWGKEFGAPASLDRASPIDATIEDPVWQIKQAYVRVARAVLEAKVFEGAAVRSKALLDMTMRDFKHGRISSVEARAAQLSLLNNQISRAASLVETEETKTNLAKTTAKFPHINILVKEVPITLGSSFHGFLTESTTEDSSQLVVRSDQRSVVLDEVDGSSRELFVSHRFTVAGADTKSQQLLHWLDRLEQKIYLLSERINFALLDAEETLLLYSAGRDSARNLTLAVDRLTTVHLDFINTLIDYAILVARIESELRIESSMLELPFVPDTSVRNVLERE